MNHNVLNEVEKGNEVVWINPGYLPFDMTKGVCELVVSDEDIEDARIRLERFAPFIMKAFPETTQTNGIIESPLVEIANMQHALEEKYICKIPGEMYLKKDSHLAIAGSIKARGGIYEVLKHAEDLALSHGMISLTDDYSKFANESMKKFFSEYMIQVGSTGNLGMSIGIMSAALGFQVVVHMSADAKQWKKDLLRSHGVKVVEYEQDYSKAVEEGRRLSDENPKSYFVDDEKSVNLFLGYAVAAGRFKKQLEEQKIVVDETHPLIVYLPAGVGGAPGGVAYGLKRIYRDNVHCFFVEPTQCPSVLLGIATRRYENANVRDYHLSGKTYADGLACASPSSFVTRIMEPLLSGEFTVEDPKLFDFLRLLYQTEGEEIEPSSCAAFIGPTKLCGKVGSQYLKEQGITKEVLENATQIVWATGGKMIPKEIRENDRNTYL